MGSSAAKFVQSFGYSKVETPFDTLLGSYLLLKQSTFSDVSNLIIHFAISDTFNQISTYHKKWSINLEKIINQYHFKLDDKSVLFKCLITYKPVGYIGRDAYILEHRNDDWYYRPTSGPLLD